MNELVQKFFNKIATTDGKSGVNDYRRFSLKDGRDYAFSVELLYASAPERGLELRLGCNRYVGFDDAFDHYGEDYDSDGDRIECRAILEALREKAKEVGWLLSPEQIAERNAAEGEQVAKFVQELLPRVRESGYKEVNGDYREYRLQDSRGGTGLVKLSYSDRPEAGVRVYAGCHSWYGHGSNHPRSPFERAFDYYGPAYSGGGNRIECLAIMQALKLKAIEAGWIVDAWKPEAAQAAQ